MKFIRGAVIAVALVASSAWASDRFGYPGSDGSDGYNGSSGSDGRSVTLFADGSSRVFDLSGTDGGDAGSGSRGGDASCPYYTGTPNEDLYGADGGDGGDAGDGGAGGDGGNITVYYENEANLRSIFVRSVPGEGGRPGSAADGGRGCYCSQHSWTNKVCHTDDQNQEVCEDRSYSCRDGSDGRDGSSGSWGRDGSYGFARLIPRREPLAPVQPSLRVGFDELTPAGAGFALSDNRWQRRDGARSLFAPGSILDDEYLWFSHRVDKTATIVWAEQRPVSDFEGSTLSLYLENDDSIDLRVNNGSIWADIRQENTDDGARFTVNRVVKESEARNLKYLGISGKGRDLVAKFEDLGGLGSLIHTRMSLVYETKILLFFWKKRFNAAVPQELVTQDANVITVALGKLPLIKEKYVTGKRKIRLSFDVTREYLGNETSFQVSKTKEEIKK